MDHRKSAGANSNRNDMLYVSIFFINRLDNSNVYFIQILKVIRQAYQLRIIFGLKNTWKNK